MDSKPKLRYLLECSVCLDLFTRPKMLPCQHTYCSSCLMTLTPDRKSITCPQCRKAHRIPTGKGIQGFPDNLIINDLLIMQKESDKDSSSDICCGDCKKTASISLCDHCQENLCAACLVQHAKLVGQIESTISELWEYTTSYRQVGTKELNHMKDSFEKLRLSKNEANNEFSKMIERLENGRRFVDEYFNMVEVLYQNLFDVTHTAETMTDTKEATQDVLGASADRATSKKPTLSTIADDLDVSLPESKTQSGLESLKKRAFDLRTAARLVWRDEEFRVVFSEGVDFANFARIEAGHRVVDIPGLGAEANKDEAAEETLTDTAEEQEGNGENQDQEFAVNQQKKEIPQKKSTNGSGTETTSTKTSTNVTPTLEASFKVGDRVRVKSTVPEFRHRGSIDGVTHASVGTVKHIKGDALLIDFPEQKNWLGVSSKMELAPERIQVGDKVRVKKSVKTPRYTWGRHGVTHASVGTVAAIEWQREKVIVDFPQQKGWWGQLNEVEHAE